MARKLHQDAQELSEYFCECDTPHKFRGATYTDGKVELSFDGFKTIQVVYFQADGYPASPAMLMCDDDQELNGQLHGLNDHFEEYAVLSDVLRAVCIALKLESDRQILEQLDASMAEADEDQASDGSASEAGYYDMNEFEDDELLKEVLQKVSRWARLEDERVQAEAQKMAEAEQQVNITPGKTSRAEAQTYLEGLASRNQIFNVREAYTMLSRELSNMMKDRSLPWAMDAVGNDAYHWEIALTQFASSSPLAQDLKRLWQSLGRSEVVLRMHFKRGLHPFYPPTVQLLWPRCRAPLLGALSSHPMLQLAAWDPWRPQKDLIEQLRLFLQEHARVVIESPLNVLGAAAAYSHLERLLAKMEALTGALPASYTQHEAVYSGRDTGVDEQHLLALAPTSKRPRTAEKQEGGQRKQSWAAGTGYSSGHHNSNGPVWDAQKAKVAQDAQDSELQTVFASLASAMDGQHLNSLTAQSDAELDGVEISDEEAVAAVRESCLFPYLEAELGQASFTDMSNRSQFYTTLLQVVTCLAEPKHAPPLFTTQTPAAAAEKTRRSVFENLCSLQRQAQHFLSVLQAVQVPPRGHASGVALPGDGQQTEEEARVKQMAELIVKIHRQAESLQPQREDTAASSGSEAAACGSNDDYIAAMRPLQLGFLEGISADHKYKERVKTEGAQPRPRTVRLGKEIAGLNNDLPLNPTSSVFVRVDEQNSSLWRALITGPDGTPYSGGCFMFDIYFPTDYPNVPPAVLITTTGGASVRFGPNLYNCGKVCLSLLGTWGGGKGEGWDPAISTTLQVLVSIQSLIFVDEPYYCEPGFESYMHTDMGKTASKAYNLKIREQTMHWAIWQQLKSPPKGFEDIVRTHFRQRKDHVLRTCQQWVDAAAADKASNARRMAKFLRDIQDLLAKLDL